MPNENGGLEIKPTFWTDEMFVIGKYPSSYDGSDFAQGQTYKHMRNRAIAADATHHPTLTILDNYVVCHCGKPAVYGYDGNPTHTRGLCRLCDAVRCDAYPGACEKE